MMTNSCDFTFSYHTRQRERFRDGLLIEEWLHRYPFLFDSDDHRVLTTAHQRKYHFFEWLSAILLFESSGYFSLVEKYTTKSHPSKRKILEDLLPPELFNWLTKNESGQPDLFVYHPETRDWFFCEVKGGSDKIRANQIEWAKSLENILIREGIPHRRKTRVIFLQELET